MNWRPLNLFYEEPDGDRWLPLDRYPRRIVRRIVRGRPKVGGQRRVFVNLCAGLDRLGVPYRVNDYRYLARHADELACVVGKPFVLDKLKGPNPILFGSAVFSHPLNDPKLFERLPVRRMLVQGEWHRKMCEPYFGDRVTAIPTGIDTEHWSPRQADHKIDFLVYDKIRWDQQRYGRELVEPVLRQLDARGLTHALIRYGQYTLAEYQRRLAQARAMIFLCEHETQGFAYQEALSSGVPILAWDKGGLWVDPEFYPDRVQFSPVSSVPYWDARCGVKFASAAEFPARLDEFLQGLAERRFSPRDYILEHLTLEKCARQYLAIVEAVNSGAPLPAAAAPAG